MPPRFKPLSSPRQWGVSHIGGHVEAVRIVEDEVRELIRRRGLDPLRQSGEVRRLVEAAVSDYDERALLAPLPPLGPLELARRFVFDAVAGFGALQPLLDDPGIEEIWLNAPNEIYVARNGESELTSVSLTDQQVRDLVERMLKSSGRRLDMSSPFVDAALPDGSRLHVVIPDVTRRHWAINIRKFVVKASRLEHLVELGTLSPQAARFLGAAVASGLNILVSGATQAGKTTMLNCLAASIGTRERVITVEEIFELQFPLRDVVGLQCRQPNLEGQGEIPLRRLVKEALRMRPDRLVVGEVREAESLDMLIALNSGLPGCGSRAIQELPSAAEGRWLRRTTRVGPPCDWAGSAHAWAGEARRALSPNCRDYTGAFCRTGVLRKRARASYRAGELVRCDGIIGDQTTGNIPPPVGLYRLLGSRLRPGDGLGIDRP